MNVCVAAGPFVLTMDHHVQLWVEPLDPFDCLFHQFARVHLVVAHQFGKRSGVEISEGIVHR